MRRAVSGWMIAAASLMVADNPAFADGWDSGTHASNIGSIANTRHNMTMSYAPNHKFMDGSRNDYGAVCVYCHTPHGANKTIDAPLWNRTNKNNAYTLYSGPLTSGQTPTQPGTNSLTCLSCHDGTVAIDSIINMPGSGGYLESQETSKNEAFLDSWAGDTNHRPLAGPWPGSCNMCHWQEISGFGPFLAFYLSTNLSDDHPIGVQLPSAAVSNFNAPNATDKGLRFYDSNRDNRPDPNEIRFYGSGGAYKVECASCHDPHGVPSGGPGSVFIPSFLRVSNSGSTLCLTCHAK